MSFQEDSLTNGSVSRLMSLQAAGDDRSFQPTVQVLSLRNVGGGTGDRFRVVLSDGQHYVQGMLATQLKAVVERGELQANSVIIVQDFMNNKVQDRNIIILLAIEVVGCADRRLGDPKDYNKSVLQDGAAGRPASATAPMYNRTNTAHASPPSAATHKAASPIKSNPYSSPRNPYSPETKSGSRLGGGGSAPVVAQGTSPSGGPPITLISNLNMYQNRWTLKARVVTKSDIRTWSNAKGEGSLFSVELLDSSGMDIRATMFKEAVDKFYNFLEIGKVYTISGGRIKVANAKFNTCKSQYEITLDSNAEIKLTNDVQGEIQDQAFEFTKISQLEHVEPNKLVDVIGVVQEISDVQSLTSKKTGRELQKADVTLMDDTGVQVRMTLWGAQAMNAPREIGVQKVVAFRRAKVSDYGGVSLSGPQGIFVEPDVAETEAIQEWYKSQGNRAAPVKSLTSSGGMGGRVDPFSDRKSISAIKGQSLGYESEKGDYLTFKAHFTFFKKDKEGGAWYTACPNKEEPCRNRCKVEQTTDGNWQCLRCQGTYPTCNRKWIFSGVVADDTASTWVSVFDDQALTLFDGATADEVFEQFENQDVYDGHFAKATYTEWIVKCRVKNEMVNDESRIKTNVVRMEPVDYAAESRNILAELEKWQI